MYIAHKRDNGKQQLLLDHLIGTAEKASRYARHFGKSDTAYLCGLLHDIGKYSEEFQDRIKNDGKLCDHSTAGAKVLKSISPAMGNLLGYVITGHHAGLLNGGSWGAVQEDGSLQGRLKKEVPDFSAYSSEITADLYPPLPNIARQLADAKPLDERDQGYSFSYLVRMIFSCLVDADFIDTEEFMSEEKITRGVECNFSELEDKIVQYTNGLDTIREINKKRREIFEQCLKKAAETPGVYKLSVPTGGGKTISSMAFSLRHIRHNPTLRRIIYVIPFTTIIEQNARVFSDILGDKYILEHHSNYDFDQNDEQYYNIKKLSAENWDIPVVVTTNVQFFESIYGNKSSRLRKLHNIANSVIILDEVQMLPVECLIPCAKALEELVNNYNCSVVLCSATQPEVERFMSEKIKAIEICSNISDLFEFFNKTRIKFIGKITADELVRRLDGVGQCLLIVNTKKQARKLYEEIKKAYGQDGVFHLSTYMCPIHRLEKIDEIRKRLSDGGRCIVVSTSLIEAGVDVDFPVVYRATCGLDSIIQAAGRCNRERRNESAYLYVFDFADEEYRVNKSSPFGNYLSQRQSITEIIAGKCEDVTRPEAIKEYFDMLFNNASLSELDKKSIVKRLNEGFDKTSPMDFDFDFEDIARDFKMIEGNDYSVIVNYNDDAEGRINELVYGYYTRGKLRSLQKYTVSLNVQEYSRLRDIDAVEGLGEKIGLLISKEDYSDEIGIIMPDQLGVAEFK
ncbi:MAG: CRISPR-associated helicase Cas3' [Clostridiales bacterium]|jgi:CRISPR-associated endonuclease/helicase Cas3|nr:CRISPR-associated helicase Cas3' [Clostridiales bacterium]